jgi:aryl carrier-like protein
LQGGLDSIIAIKVLGPWRAKAELMEAKNPKEMPTRPSVIFIIESSNNP